MAKRKKVVRRRRSSLRGLAGTAQQHGNAAISTGRALKRELEQAGEALSDGVCSTAFMHLMNANRALGAHNAEAYWRDDLKHDMDAMRQYGGQIEKFGDKLAKACFKAKR